MQQIKTMLHAILDGAIPDLEQAVGDLTHEDVMDTINEELELDDEFVCEEYEYEDDDGDWMDADALASAGWGTDEDYGYYGQDEW